MERASRSRRAVDQAAYRTRAGRCGILRATFERCTTANAQDPPSTTGGAPDGTSWSAADRAWHSAAEWATPAGVGYAGRIVMLYTADNGGTSPYGPNSDVYARTGTP